MSIATQVPETQVIDTCQKLADAIQYLDQCCVVGIDAEWPPETTHHRPAATLLQLACWSPSWGVKIFLLDLLRLEIYDVAPPLQRLFRRSSALKLGWSLAADVFAVREALGKHRGSAVVAVITSVLDLKSLYRYLLHAKVEGVQAAVDEGLSEVVNSQFGVGLDKTQQCSSWGERPLSQEQIRYAATDAACLLGLLDAYLECAQAEEESVPSSIHGRQHKHLEEGCEQAAAAPHARPERAELSVHPTVKRALKVNWSVEKMSRISTAWAQRWELAGGGRLLRSGGAFDAMKKSSAERVNGSTGARNGKCQGGAENGKSSVVSALPICIPWLGGDGQATGTPRFIGDVMLQGLARQLRLWGIDAEAIETVAKQQRHVVHRQLVERAQDEGRVILTRDATFMRRNLSDRAYFVSANDKQTQLEEVVRKFHLTLKHGALLSRCARCNGEFFDEPVPGDQLPPDCGVLPEVAAKQGVKFWVCRRCGAAYWQGNMYARAMERLMAKLERFRLQGGEEQEESKGNGTEVIGEREVVARAP